MARQRDGRKMRKEEQEQARRQAMGLLDKEWTQKRVGQAVSVSERTVRQWVAYRRDHSLAALVRDERGRKIGQGRALNARQEKVIQRLILDQTPEQLKLPFALWIRKAVGQLIQRRCGLGRRAGFFAPSGGLPLQRCF